MLVETHHMRLQPTKSTSYYRMQKTHVMRLYKNHN